MFSQCKKSDSGSSSKNISGSFTLESQAQVNAFVKSYKSYGSVYINGNLLIGNIGNTNSDITDISGLRNITYVSNQFTISFNLQLKTLNGLQGLTQAGAIEIMGNSELTNLQGLNSLKTVIGNFFIEVNQNIQTTSGLDNLQYVYGSLKIANGVSGGQTANNPNLQTLTFPALAWVGNSCDFSNEPAVTTFNFPKLDSIKGDLSISGGLLTNFNGLNHLRYVGGDFGIANTAAVNFTGLNGLTDINGSFNVTTNSNLVNFTGLDSLTFIGQNLNITSNNSLTALDGLNSLKSITRVLVMYNASLNSYCGIKPLIVSMMAAKPGIDPNTYISLVDNTNALGGNLTTCQDVINNCH